MFDHARKIGVRGLAAAVVTAGAALMSFPAAAQHHGDFHGGGYHGGYHGGYRGGYRGDWHGHGWYGGGWGWGFGAGLGVGLYDPWWPGYYSGYWDPGYAYYASPPVTVIQPAPVVQAPPVQAAPPSYYYCDNPAGYYPYVQQCSQPWRQVAPQPAPPQQ